MCNVIGYKHNPATRLEYWQAMLTYKQGSRELLRNPETIEIAIEDGKRYNRILNHYMQDADEAEKSSNRH
jgi:hypothetical protein